MIQNRRRSLRTNTSGLPCVVRLGVGEDQGIVVDESEEGIGIDGLDILILFADQKVTMFHDHKKVIGRCRAVSSRRVPGSESFEENPKSFLLNSFTRFNEYNMVCVPIGVIDEDQIRIQFSTAKNLRSTVTTFFN